MKATKISDLNCGHWLLPATMPSARLLATGARPAADRGISRDGVAADPFTMRDGVRRPGRSGEFRPVRRNWVGGPGQTQRGPPAKLWRGRGLPPRGGGKTE